MLLSGVQYPEQGRHIAAWRTAFTMQPTRTARLAVTPRAAAVAKDDAMAAADQPSRMSWAEDTATARNTLPSAASSAALADESPVGAQDVSAQTVPGPDAAAPSAADGYPPESATLGPHALGLRIASLRHANGWSQRRLAEAAGVSHGYIALLELGRLPSPGKFRLDAVARALKLRTSDALTAPVIDAQPGSSADGPSPPSVPAVHREPAIPTPGAGPQPAPGSVGIGIERPSRLDSNTEA
ncbi:MAG: helix-turn-helix transcriptional regulator, partial [Chloroflexi bacterium]|nr:helix-turn-helix transcriptional regulator [Chloroflexota bacterium]